MLTFKKITENVFLASSDKKTPWKCHGLIIKGSDGKSVFIDCNFEDDELKELIDFAGSKPQRYYITHVHVDHVTNVHRIEKLGIPVFCPVPEDKYIVDGERLMAESGAPRYNLFDEMKAFLFKYAGYRNIKDVIPYIESDIYKFGNIEIKPLSLPGHSPGHTGFIIRDLNGKERPVLFSSDMGIEKIGAWYGFDYCDVTDLKNSLDEIDRIYSEDDFILTGSHCEIFYEKVPDLFREVNSKIEKSKLKILTLMDGRGAVSPDDLVFNGVYYRTSSIDKMDEFTKKLYFFWEGSTIKNLMENLECEGFISKESDNKWVLNFEIARDLLYKGTLKEVFNI